MARGSREFMAHYRCWGVRLFGGWLSSSMESETARLLLERLRQLREKCGLTQEAFAERAGLQYKHYQAVEAGRKPDLRLSTLEKLAKALEVEPWELLHPTLPVPAVEEPPAKYGDGRPARKKPARAKAR